MQNETTRKHYGIYIRKAKTKTLTMLSPGEEAEQLKFSHAAGGMQMVQLLWKTCLAVS